MICKSGNFNTTTEENEDDIQMEMKNSILQEQQNIIGKSYLLNKLHLEIKILISIKR